MENNKIGKFYGDFLAGLSDNTSRTYDSSIKCFTKYVWDKKPQDITLDDLKKVRNIDVQRKYVSRLRDEGIKEKSIATYLRAVRALLKGLDKNEWFGDEVNLIRVRDKVLDFKLHANDGGHNGEVTLEELEQLKKWLLQVRYDDGAQYAELVDFMFKTAIRITAALNVRWKDFMVFDSSYGGTWARLEVIDKGKKLNVKNLPIRQYERLQRVCGYDSSNKDELVFKGLSANVLRQMMTRFGNEVLHRDGISPHALKVGAANTFYNQTHDMVELQQFLDHSNINTTREYLRANPDPNLQAINMMNNLDKVENNEWEKVSQETIMDLIKSNRQLKTMVTNLLVANGTLD